MHPLMTARARWRRLSGDTLCLTVLWALAVSPHRGIAQDSTQSGVQGGAPIRLPQAASGDAWEQSLALEARGDIAEARSVMLTAFGARPATYDPCVRLAWLNFRLANGAEAAALYQRARDLPGSLPEATVGLGLALTMRGYAELERGALGAARLSWAEALAIDASNHDAQAGLARIGAASGLAPEVWGAALSATWNASSARVWYAQLPVRLSHDLGVRVAFRQVASPAFTGSQGVFGSQSEFYGGIAKDIGIATIELVALGFRGTGRSNSGAALSARIGGSYGVTTTASLIARTGGTNLQVAPMVFAYLGPYVALAVGARVTTDSAFRAVSPLAGLTVRTAALQLDIAAHAGREQWAYSPAGPTVMSILDHTTSGAWATLGYHATALLTMFAQLQWERTGGSGSFTSIGFGLRFAPRGSFFASASQGVSP